MISAIAWTTAPALADCDRDAFKDWKTKDYTNTRALVLERDAKGQLDWLKRGTGQHIVRRGTWRDAFTGQTLHHITAKNVHVDHVIPVCFAWDRGAKHWTEGKRRSFYNDRSLLIVTEAGHNQAKGARPPWEYLPRNCKDARNYARMFMDGVQRYSLKLSSDEVAALHKQIAQGCPSSDYVDS